MNRSSDTLKALAKECENAGIEHADSAVAGGFVSDGGRIVEAAACFAVAAALRVLADNHEGDAALARVEELEKALEPFATHAQWQDGPDHHEADLYGHSLLVGDFRRARALLSEGGE